MKTLASKVTAASIVGLVIAGSGVGVGVWSSSTLAVALQQSGNNAVIVRNHMEADMMHDALRADVFASLLGNDPNAQIRAELEEHVANFREAVADNEARAGDGSIKDALEQVAAPFEAYVASAERLSALAGTDRQEAEAQLPGFLEAFSDLEEQMAGASDAIEGIAERDALTATRLALLGRLFTSISLVLVVAFFAALIVAARRFALTPLAAMAKSMNALAEGDLDRRSDNSNRSDEIGVMAAALENFRLAAIEMRRMASENVADAAAKVARGQQVSLLTAAFESETSALSGLLAGAATRMEAAAGSMSATATDVSRRTTAVSAVTEHASANAQDVAGAAEELAASVREIAAQLARASAVAGRAVLEVRETDEAMQALTRAAHQIGDVIRFISSIASQTNPLALNATIEAARAGEAGRGFTVVATEVKALADQTTKATDDIAAQIAAIQRTTEVAVDKIRRIGGSIAEANEVASAIASAVEQQRAATEEIARHVQQAACGTAEVADNMTVLGSAADTAGIAAVQVLESARELGRQSRVLDTEVTRFLVSVKAA